MTWQPIETAPKDGRWFWAKRAHHSDRKGIELSAFKWDESHEMWFAGTGWWHQFPMSFTHWMPLLGQPPELPDAC